MSGNDSGGNAFNYRYLMKRVVPGAGYAYLTLPVGQQLATAGGARQRVAATRRHAMDVDQRFAERRADRRSWKPAGVFRDTAELPGYVLYGNEDLRYQLFVPVSDTLGGMSVKCRAISVATSTRSVSRRPARRR